ncbi:MAG: hypothetical protein AAF628_13580 [Planctomycetota bacterium]
MTSPQRGAALGSGLALLLLLALGAIAVIAYQGGFGGVIGARAQHAVRQWSEWTPENIAAAPGAYLDAAENRAEELLKTLEEQRLAADLRLDQAAKLQKHKARRNQSVETARDGLIAAYRGAVAAKQWPLTWRSRSFDQAQAGAEIVRLDRMMRAEAAGDQMVADTIAKLTGQLQRIRDAKAQCKTQIVEIRASRERLEAKQLGDRLDEHLATLREVLDGSAAIVSADDPSAAAVRDLVRETEHAVREKELQEILNR